MDRILPDWTVREIHETTIDTSRDVLWEAVRHLDFSASWLTRILFGLRGIDRVGLTLQDMVKDGPFRVFAEESGFELVMGLVCNTKMVPVPMETLEDFQGYVGEPDGLEFYCGREGWGPLPSDRDPCAVHGAEESAVVFAVLDGHPPLQRVDSSGDVAVGQKAGHENR